MYIIDLVAAGLLQQDKRQKQQEQQQHEGASAAEAAATAAASDLVAGLAAVFEDPSCTLVVQDARQVGSLAQSLSETGKPSHQDSDKQRSWSCGHMGCQRRLRQGNSVPYCTDLVVWQYRRRA